MSWKITSHFMQREGFRLKGHSGLDFAMENNTPLRSIKDGVITKIVDYGERNVGKGILVKWEDGKVAIYGHLSKFNKELEVGDKVKAGDLLGYSGNSGHVVGKNGGYHLHFGIKEEGRYIDPSPYINDIQHMNDKGYFVQKAVEHVQKSPEFVKVNFFEYMKQHINVLSEVKLQFIDVLTNDVMVIQILQQCFQFFSAHSGLFNNVIACIF